MFSPRAEAPWFSLLAERWQPWCQGSYGFNPVAQLLAHGVDFLFTSCPHATHHCYVRDVVNGGPRQPHLLHLLRRGGRGRVAFSAPTRADVPVGVGADAAAEVNVSYWKFAKAELTLVAS